MQFGRRKNKRTDYNVNLAKVIAGLGLAATGAAVGRPALKGLGAALRRKGVYGKEIAALARSKGISTNIPKRIMRDIREGYDYNTGGLLQRLKKVLGEKKGTRLHDYLGNTLTGTRPPPTPGGVRLSAFDAGGSRKGFAKIVGATATPEEIAAANKKINQMRLIRDSGHGHMIPETAFGDEFSALIKKRKASGKNFRIRDLYDDRFGQGNWWLKSDAPDAAGSLVSMSPKELPATLLRGKTNAQIEKLLSDPRFIVARTTPPETMGKVRQFIYKRLGIDRLSEKMYRGIYGRDVKWPPTQEMRVHIMNHKIIPFATSDKWDAPNYLSPFRSRRRARVEKALQRMFDDIGKNQSQLAKDMNTRNQVFGADIGIGHGGRPIIYELNPTGTQAGGYGSGQVSLPHIRNALQASVKGTLPAAQKIQLGTSGTLLAGGTALTRSGISRREST